MEIQDYTLKVLHEAGTQLIVADILSLDAVCPSPCPYCDESVSAVLEECALPSNEELIAEQTKEISDDNQHLQRREDYITEQKGVSMKIHRGNPKVLVPNSLTDTTMK